MNTLNFLANQSSFKELPYGDNMNIFLQAVCLSNCIIALKGTQSSDTNQRHYPSISSIIHTQTDT